MGSCVCVGGSYGCLWVMGENQWADRSQVVVDIYEVCTSRATEVYGIVRG